MTEGIKTIKLADKARDFLWIKQQFEENKLFLRGWRFGKTNFDKFRLAIKCVQNIYEGLWDLDIRERYTPDGDFEGYSIEGIIVYFQEITITNSNRRSHVIEKLFTKIHLGLEGSNLIVAGLSGARIKTNYAEWSSNYIHSHLSGNRLGSGSCRNGDLAFSSFCLGSGEIRDYIMDISAEGFTQVRFNSFLLQIISLVSWESLEGGPHKKMARIRIQSNRGQLSTPSRAEANTLLRNILQRHRSEDIVPKIDFVITKEGYSIVDNEKFEAFITARFTEEDKRRFICMLGTTDQYYKYGSIPGFDEPPVITNKYIFQGEEINLEVGEAPATITEEDVEYFLHPNIKIWIKENLEYEINEKKIRQSTVDRYTN